MSSYLQAAGNAVKRASDNLVKAAQKAVFDKPDDNSVVVKTKFVGGIAQVTSCVYFYTNYQRSVCICGMNFLLF